MNYIELCQVVDEIEENGLSCEYGEEAQLLELLDKFIPLLKAIADDIDFNITLASSDDDH